MCKVLNANIVGPEETEDRVYVARPSKWGNPFVEDVDGTREEVIARYREYLVQQPHLMAALPELKGKDLICWCVPQQCHAQFLLELANKPTED